MSVTDGLCFIDWATKCKHGDSYNQFYDYSAQCGDNWIDDQISKLERERFSNSKAEDYLKKARALKLFLMSSMGFILIAGTSHNSL